MSLPNTPSPKQRLYETFYKLVKLHTSPEGDALTAISESVVLLGVDPDTLLGLFPRTVSTKSVTPAIDEVPETSTLDQFFN